MLKKPIVLLHAFDPRGTKVGGLETYCREFIRHCPIDLNLFVIGVDAIGNLRIGNPVQLELFGRALTFLPVAKYEERKMAEAATKLKNSLTLAFTIGLIKNLGKIRKTIPSGATFDVRRVETAWLPALLRAPFIQMLHGEGAPRKPMDSMLSKFSYVHNFAQTFAVNRSQKFLCVNPIITDRIRLEYPRHSRKIDTLVTWANPDIFKAIPPNPSKAFRIVFCGRLDLFKRPDLMFRAVAALQTKSRRPVQLRLMGASNPKRYKEFSLVESITELLPAGSSSEVHRAIADSDCGILTSEFEGLPRFVLECLSTGRPVVTSNLAQLEPILKNGENGFLVQLEGRSEADFVDEVATALRQVDEGKLTTPWHLLPEAIAGYRPAPLLRRVFEYHREIA